MYENRPTGTPELIKFIEVAYQEKALETPDFVPLSAVLEYTGLPLETIREAAVIRRELKCLTISKTDSELEIPLFRWQWVDAWLDKYYPGSKHD